ncbi:hypothetical protein J6W34_04595 [bacterium]|nr:hypothetical protein [bacterium]
MSDVWNNILLPFLMTYGTSLLTAIVIGLILGLFSLSTLVIKKINSVLINLADKHLSEKVSLRVKDALSKVEDVLIDLISIETNELKKMANEALQNDGKIDMKEVKDMSKKVTEVALKKLTTEADTLKKYVAGNEVSAFIEDKVSAIVTQSVEKLVEQKLSK